jgi:protein-S-isoprenylcysteine O-methyltransferase Ste14
VESVNWISICVASFCALGRSLGILGAKVRQLRYRRRAVDYPSSWRDRCTQPEPLLLLLTTLTLIATRAEPGTNGALQVAGACLSGSGISLMLWAVVSFPSVSPGHYILPEHQLVTAGPYGWVRHPLYLAALLIWGGLALAFQSMVAGALTLLYVLPSYLIYIRSEEEMMSRHFGEAYEEYSQKVGRLLPRIG